MTKYASEARVRSDPSSRPERYKALRMFRAPSVTWRIESEKEWRQKIKVMACARRVSE